MTKYLVFTFREEETTECECGGGGIMCDKYIGTWESEADTEIIFKDIINRTYVLLLNPYIDYQIAPNHLWENGKLVSITDDDDFSIFGSD